MDAWHDFFVAQVGASAALAGLIFVGVSISLDQIVRFPHLVMRAGTALALLLVTLLVSSVLLAPLQSVESAGAVVVGPAVPGWLVTTVLGLGSMRRTPRAYRGATLVAALMAQVAIVPFVIAGVVLTVSGTDRLYWLLPGVLLCFVVALVDGWVVLVVTHR